MALSRTPNWSARSPEHAVREPFQLSRGGRLVTPVGQLADLIGTERTFASVGCFSSSAMALRDSSLVTRQAARRERDLTMGNGAWRIQACCGLGAWVAANPMTLNVGCLQTQILSVRITLPRVPTDV